MKKNKKILIFHQFNLPEHFRGLYYYCNRKNIDIKYYSFTITPIKSIAKMVLRRETKSIIADFRNIYFLISNIFTKNNLILLSIAPFDYRLYYLLKILKRHRVLFFTSWPSWDQTFFPMKRFANAKLIRECWGKLIEKHVTTIFTVSKTSADSLNNNYKLNSEPIIVNHSYEKKYFYPAKNKKYTKIFKLLFVGRFTESKGIFEILKLATLLKESSVDYEIVFVGYGELENIIAKYCQANCNCKLIGAVKDREKLGEIYRNSDFLLLPSQKYNRWEELFGIVILEAMACGVIPISSNHVGPCEIISNTINGYLFNEKEYSQRTVELLATLSLEEIMSIRKNAIEKSGQYSEDVISLKWQRALEKII